MRTILVTQVRSYYQRNVESDGYFMPLPKVGLLHWLCLVHIPMRALIDLNLCVTCFFYKVIVLSVME